MWSPLSMTVHIILLCLGSLTLDIRLSLASSVRIYTPSVFVELEKAEDLPYARATPVEGKRTTSRWLGRRMTATINRNAKRQDALLRRNKRTQFPRWWVSFVAGVVILVSVVLHMRCSLHRSNKRGTALKGMTLRRLGDSPIKLQEVCASLEPLLKVETTNDLSVFISTQGETGSQPVTETRLQLFDEEGGGIEKDVQAGGESVFDFKEDRKANVSLAVQILVAVIILLALFALVSMYAKKLENPLHPIDHILRGPEMYNHSTKTHQTIETVSLTDNATALPSKSTNLKETVGKAAPPHSANINHTVGTAGSSGNSGLFSDFWTDIKETMGTVAPSYFTEVLSGTLTDNKETVDRADSFNNMKLVTSRAGASSSEIIPTPQPLEQPVPAEHQLALNTTPVSPSGSLTSLSEKQEQPTGAEHPDSS